ncbi:hypothetical protein TWF694_004279 [Orbilia ellipsospora]|uniref:Uncharacterized protein n=1 Tax=Orbilia ellipsospora TaxID=2528407 RepID=A0AAV9WYW0_9PEZI
MDNPVEKFWREEKWYPLMQEKKPGVLRRKQSFAAWGKHVRSGFDVYHRRLAKSSGIFVKTYPEEDLWTSA